MSVRPRPGSFDRVQIKTFPGRVAAAVLALEVLAVTCFAFAWRPLDLWIYVLGGRAVGDDATLYTQQQAEHWFTYPPFAAILFDPLSALPFLGVRVAWELACVAALAWVIVVAGRLAGRQLPVVPLLAAALILEPVWHTLFLGQVNLFLLALILTDVWLVSRGRCGGFLIGAAAAIKLTPAIFIVFLLLGRRYRAAAIASSTFVACGLVAYLAAPAASRLYWSGLFRDTTRVGASYIGNQSPFGALNRLLDMHVGSWYLAIPLFFGLGGLLVARAYLRRGDWLTAAVATGVTGLLVSPISWTHHWIWVVPALLVLLLRGAHRWAALGFLVYALAPMWFTPHDGGPGEYGPHGLITLIANSYLLAGVAFLGYLGWTLRSDTSLAGRVPASSASSGSSTVEKVPAAL